MWRLIWPFASSRPTPQPVDAGVVADGGEVLYALSGKRADQILRIAAETEPADHDGGSVEDVLDRLFGAGDDLVHGRGNSK